MSSPILPPVPAQAPRINSRFWPWLMRSMLRLSGWRLLGQLPDLPKLIIIGAPHSSYWDGVWGLMMKIGLGANINVMIKREVLDGPLGIILRPVGMIPINRSAALNVVGQMVKRFAEYERMWLGITPEGTRKHVKHWKSGFLRIAREANVPIQTVFIDYPSKTFTLGPLVHASDDPDADMATIRAMFRPYRGKHRNTE
ncbi:1-acyl-sn-glycerol-3-phosphate acyltransferase [Dyella mobilis]|uniref:1-acyl-sn-glycerol-3-phosphate acyltransferase n=1 Tax=Dyella mobilis TaxID=1849582 RepID=A0ABS2KBH8_9GAMM|nr:1-acyl-sn-glycerol-3-phosphate acyltransferase [Dyella mobilis]MBM7128170.1 1-acyl-sn-glycerol-3-phosphate acyltransferase [Dyella mobilis]GLQ99987.1 acyltransferase [Dyella mobilis]